MNKLTFFLTLLFCYSLVSCKGQSQSKQAENTSIDNFKAEILPEAEMRKTTEKAITLIQSKNYKEFRNLFAFEVVQNVSDQQMIQLVDQLNLLLQKEGVPSGDDNILPAVSATIQAGDTLFVNRIMYNFKPISVGTSSSQKVLIFSFLKKFGTKKLFGVTVHTNPLSAGNTKPTIKQLDEFRFNVSDITRFRIYFDEGPDRRTKFKNKTGYFAVEGDASTLEKAGLNPFVSSIFGELAKSKFDQVKVFNTTIDEDKVKFIQAEFALRDKPYSLYLYLPIGQSGQYKNKIILRQREYANLGYEYILSQEDYPKISAEFPKVAELKLESYYVDQP